jgi:hypothetical protein
MTYTLPFIHKYRFIIAILLAAFVSAAMIALKPTTATTAQAASNTNSGVSYYVAPALFRNADETTAVGNGPIAATGKLTFERPTVTTTPAPKKETPVVEKITADTPAPSTTPATTPAPAPVTAPVPAVQPDTTQAVAPANTPVGPVATASMEGTSPAAAQAFARSYLAGKGMGDAEFQCLVTLWNRESGWNFQAKNSSSGAYGIPQSLPGSKMASAGADWQTNPQTQIIWGLKYIDGRYGSPCGAVAVWNTQGWY